MAIEAVTVADAVGARLRTRVLSGELAAGSEVKDTNVARELGVARPTARIAVQRLISEGLLERVPGHSARVKAFGIADISDLYRMRRLLEFEAVRAVIDAGAPLDPVRLVLNRFASLGAADSWEQASDADASFHSAVVNCAGSDRLSRLFRGLDSEIRLVIAQLRPAYGDLRELFLEHSELFALLEEGDYTSTLAAWESHLAGGETFLLGSIREVNS